MRTSDQLLMGLCGAPFFLLLGDGGTSWTWSQWLFTLAYPTACVLAYYLFFWNGS